MSSKLNLIISSYTFSSWCIFLRQSVECDPALVFTSLLFGYDPTSGS